MTKVQLGQSFAHLAHGLVYNVNFCRPRAISETMEADKHPLKDLWFPLNRSEGRCAAGWILDMSCFGTLPPPRRTLFHYFHSFSNLLSCCNSNHPLLQLANSIFGQHGMNVQYRRTITSNRPFILNIPGCRHGMLELFAKVWSRFWTIFCGQPSHSEVISPQKW